MKIDSTIQKDFLEKFAGRVSFHAPLAPYLAYRVGGPADILVFPKDEEELTWIAEKSQAWDLPITTIGAGTNLLVLDGGIRGITVSLLQANKKIERLESNAEMTLVRAGGGIEKQTLLEWSITHALGGLEFSAGVPGTLGGGIFMNAGTQYGCYGDIIKEVRLFHFLSGARTYSREEAEFGYREQSLVTKDTLVLWATLKLRPTDSDILRKEVDRIICERKAKQPLHRPSCGSTFKNPPSGLSAGRLIERTGLKGLKSGGASVSDKHANFILNEGNATAQDILSLIQMIKNRVNQEFAVKLECEVIVLGDARIPQQN